MQHNGKPAAPGIRKATAGLLKPQNVVVSDEFDMVTLKVGNVELKFSYETALALSQMLRLHGRKAKRFAGDTSRRYSARGILHDASAPPRPVEV